MPEEQTIREFLTEIANRCARAGIGSSCINFRDLVKFLEIDLDYLDRPISDAPEAHESFLKIAEERRVLSKGMWALAGLEDEDPFD